MEILGIGPSELVLIVILALIILGPRDMQKAGRTLGQWLRRVVTSDGWKFFQQTSREIQTLPNRLMRDAALEELQKMEQDIRRPLQETNRGITAAIADRGGDSAGSAPRELEPRILPSPPGPTIKTDPDKNA
jgi:sec-independent protein translocase protein TatB